MIATVPPDVDLSRAKLLGTGRRPVVEIVASAYLPSAGDDYARLSPAVTATDPATHARVAESETQAITLNVPRSAEKIKWNQALQKEYDNLSMKEAFAEADQEDLLRLDELQEIRRKDACPRSAKEMVLEFERRQALNAVISSMKTYVQLFKRGTHEG